MIYCLGYRLATKIARMFAIVKLFRLVFIPSRRFLHNPTWNGQLYFDACADVVVCLFAINLAVGMDVSVTNCFLNFVKFVC